MCPLVSSKSPSTSSQMAAYLSSCVTCHTASQTRPKRERTSIVRQHPRTLLSFHHVKCQSVRVCLCVFVYVTVHKTACVCDSAQWEMCICVQICFAYMVFCMHRFYPAVAPLTVACIWEGKIRCQTPWLCECLRVFLCIRLVLRCMFCVFSQAICMASEADSLWNAELSVSWLQTCVFETEEVWLG